MKQEFRELACDLAAYIKGLDEDTYVSATVRQRDSATVRQMDSATATDKGAQDAAQQPLVTGPRPEVITASAKQQDSVTVAGKPEANTAPKAAVSGVEMSALAAEIRDCHKCQLGNSRIHAVVGVGDPHAEIVFVGEGPGFQEDHQGEPFVGRSGQLLDKILETVLGLKRENVYIANIVKCHPMMNPEAPEAHGNDRPPTIEEISACRPYLDRQLMLIKPKCIVTLGSVATKVLLGVTQGISSMRGKWYDYPVELFGPGHPIKVLPTYHPAALLRNPNLKRDTWEDMKMLKAFIENN